MENLAIPSDLAKHTALSFDLDAPHRIESVLLASLDARVTKSLKARFGFKDAGMPSKRSGFCSLCAVCGRSMHRVYLLDIVVTIWQSWELMVLPGILYLGWKGILVSAFPECAARREKETIRK